MWHYSAFLGKDAQGLQVRSSSLSIRAQRNFGRTCDLEGHTAWLELTGRQRKLQLQIRVKPVIALAGR